MIIFTLQQLQLIRIKKNGKGLGESKSKAA